MGLDASATRGVRSRSWSDREGQISIIINEAGFGAAVRVDRMPAHREWGQISIVITEAVSALPRGSRSDPSTEFGRCCGRIEI
jgi:hypothetical protein